MPGAGPRRLAEAGALKSSKKPRAQPRRTQARGIATRKRLLEAAHELFASRGFAAVSRADVARRAGYGMSTVYHHFRDTREMLLQLIDEWARTMPVKRRAAFDVQTAIGGDTRRAAAEYLRKTYAELRLGPSFYRVMLAEAARDEEVGRHYQAVQRGVTAWIAELTRAGQRAGMLRPECRPEAGAFLMNHVIESTLSELVSQNLDEELRREVLAELARMICAYLLPEGPSRPRSS